jgi:glycosyltransferase involved in cell wall biosynthesis
MHYFQPEPNFFVGLPFAKELARRGHSVQVLTGFPNYPGGKIYKGYKQKLIQQEEMEGISVIRVPLYPSHDRSSLKRVLSYMSLSLSQAMIGPFVVDKADVAYVSQGPATIGFPSIVHKLFRRIPYVYSIQDLWPDSLEATGMFSTETGLKIVGLWCKQVYRLASKVVVISPGMKKLLIERGVPEEKIEIVYNWCDDSLIYRGQKDENLAKEFGMSNKFNIVFAGNMGKAQAIDKVVEAAKILKDKYPDIQFVFIGGGVEVDNLKKLAQDYHLNNVIFHERRPIEEIGSILKLADVLLVHLRDEKLFRITIPSKTQAYMALGRPILIGVSGDAGQLVEQAKAGLACEPENPDSIAKSVERLHNMDGNKLKQMGQNAIEFYDKNLSFKIAAGYYEHIFEAVLRKKNL